MPPKPPQAPPQAPKPSVSSLFVDDIEPPKKPKTDPLKIAEKQVLRAAERFKEVDSTVEDPDEHLTWDTASALERSIDNVKRNKERHSDHLYGESVHEAQNTPTSGSTSSSTARRALDENLLAGSGDLALTPTAVRLIFAGIVLVVGVICYMLGSVVGESNSVAPEDSSSGGIFSVHPAVTLEGLWLGTDSVNGASANVEYLFNRPGSLTILTLSPTGAVQGISQSDYEFAQSQLTTTPVGTPSSSTSAIAPTSATVTSGTNMISLKSADKTIVLRRPLSIIGTWSTIGTEGSNFKYVFNSNGTATVPDPASSSNPKPINGNYVVAGNTLTLTQPNSISAPIKWTISFDSGNLLLTSVDANGTSNTVILHPG